MDNHPIPQDVTGFQFRLIGSLTIKQFGYIGASAILVAILYYIPGLAIYIKAPLIVILGCIGPAFAFLPIEGRPMDQMAAHFVHALIRPNQYLFIKAGGKLPLSMIELKSVRQMNEKQLAEKKEAEEKLTKKEEKLNMYLRQIHQGSSEADKKESAFMQNVLSGQPLADRPLAEIPSEPPQAPTTAPTPTVLPNASPQPEPLAATIQMPPPPAPTIASANPPPQEQAAPQIVATPAVPQTLTVPAPTPGVGEVTNDMAPKVGIPTLPGNPNLVQGIVKDARGNVLPHILVEIKDKDENPVRAFKTNTLGQFAAATPLPNGTYTIVFEDPKGEHSFDVVEITASGEIIPAIEIISHDAREALRQQLFG